MHYINLLFTDILTLLFALSEFVLMQLRSYSTVNNVALSSNRSK